VIHEVASAGFGRAADAYERGRPGYPEEALDWLWDALELAPGSVAIDVGAGTGKLTAPLVARGAAVTAVEPVSAMRDRLAAAVAGATAVDGTAERLPVPDETADAVVAGQAFHWFANGRSLAEFHRVLRPGGALGLIWNRRLLDDPLQAAVSELLDPLRGDAPRYASGDWRPSLERTELFRPAGSHAVRFVQELDEEGLVDRIGSTSFVAALADAPRRELLGRVRHLVPHGGMARLPYVCEAFAYRRRA
jgi:SAM-dependent methyltransferase